jgi:hypothetical protein
VRLWLAGALVLSALWLAARMTSGHRHSLAIPLLVAPGLVLASLEFRDWREVERMAATASALAGRDVSVSCQRLGATLIDVGSELGYVEFDAQGRPDDIAHLEYEACENLRDWLRSPKTDPTRDQVIAVHVLAHEAWHLRGEANEAITECSSLQRTAAVAQSLGATPDRAQRLAEAYWEGVYPFMPAQYRSAGCQDGGALDLDADSDLWP